MITNLREAKSRLSHLVQMAAEGEEIVITVHGQPRARLTGVASPERTPHERREWAAELRAGADAARKGEGRSTSQEFWDDLREERF